MSDAFLALADSTRREILLRLGRQPRNAGDIAEGFAQQRPAISKHLAVLRDAGLVIERRERQQRIYSLNPAGLLPVRAYLGILATGDSAVGEGGRGLPEPRSTVIRQVSKPRALGTTEIAVTMSPALRGLKAVTEAAAGSPPLPAPAPPVEYADDRRSGGASMGNWDLDFD